MNYSEWLEYVCAQTEKYEPEILKTYCCTYHESKLHEISALANTNRSNIICSDAEKNIRDWVCRMQEFYEKKIWAIEGGRGDNSDYTKNRHYFMARKQICYIIADVLLESYSEKGFLISPSFLFDYLHDISVADFKRLKAYYIWENEGRKFNINDMDRQKDYKAASSFLEKTLNCPIAEEHHMLKEHLNNLQSYLQNNDERKLISQKAHWRRYEGNNLNDNENWYKSSNYVESFYRTLKNALNNKKSGNLPSLAEREDILEDMFEYSQFPLLKFVVQQPTSWL